MFKFSNKQKKEESDKIYLLKKVSLVDKYNFYDYIWMMIDWWVSVPDALSSVVSKIKNQYFVSKINELKMYISSWDSFSRAMKKIPSLFSSSEIAIVESWEVSWELDKTLMRLSEDLKRIHNLYLKIKWALTYPIIIFVFLLIAVLIVLAYVIPSILPVFSNSWVELPFATKLLISTSNFIVNNFFLLIFLFVLIIIAFLIYKNTEKWQLAISNLLLKTPLIWSVYRNYLLAIFASNLWSLISSWLPIIKSFNLSAKALNNLEYEKLIQKVIKEISSWNKITDSLQNADKKGFYFTPDFIQLFSVWEKTASLWVVSKKISTQYEIEVDNSLTNLTKWIEPIAILIAGFFVMWFAFAIFWAILKVTQTVG